MNNFFLIGPLLAAVTVVGPVSCSISSSVSSSSSPGGPVTPDPAVQWTKAQGGNDKYYQAVSTPGNIEWDGADKYARAHGGYLATIHSKAENEFVFSVCKDSKFWYNDSTGNSGGPYIGGVRNSPSSNSADGWQWDDGSGTITYTNWAPGEPNGGGYENRMMYWGKGFNDSQPLWNDCSDNNLQHGFVVEYDTAPPPVPATTIFTPWFFPVEALVLGLLTMLVMFIFRTRKPPADQDAAIASNRRDSLPERCRFRGFEPQRV